MIQEPAYYAIIPAPVRYDRSLPAAAKLLYGEITALCSAKGYCWAGNSYFANLYGVDKDTVSNWISKLQKAGHICVELDRSAGNTRNIYLSDKMPEPIRNPSDSYPEKTGEVYDKNRIGIGKKQDSYTTKDRHNNTLTNTESITDSITVNGDAPAAAAATPPPPTNESKNRPVEEKASSTPKVPPAPPSSPAKKEKPPKEHFFSESPYYDRQAFIDALTGTDYEIYDLAFYHETVKNWADSGTSAKFRKANWLATARGFMTRDAKEGKARLNPNLKPVTPTSTQNLQVNGNGRYQRPTAPAHHSPEQRASRATALLNRIDREVGHSSNKSGTR